MLSAAAEGFVLSDVFLPDGDAALELDLDLRLSDDDLFDQRSHDGCVVCVHDRAVFDATLEGVEDNLELSVLIHCPGCRIPLFFERLHLLAVLFDLCRIVRCAHFHPLLCLVQRQRRFL